MKSENKKCERNLTIVTWKCKTCGYEIDIPVFTFIKKCGNCNAEYELLGEAIGIYGMSPLPIFRLKNESFENQQLKNRLKFIFSVKAKKIECFNDDFYNLLIKKYSKEITEKKTIIEMNEKKSEL